MPTQGLSRSRHLNRYYSDKILKFNCPGRACTKNQILFGVELIDIY